MPPVPRPVFARLCLAALLASVVLPAWAAKVAQVQVKGLDPAMTENVRGSLSLVDAIGKDVSGRRLAYLVREAEAETREALEPFGYYSPVIDVQRTRGADDAPVTVTITVQPGTPVRVRNSDVGISGDGASDHYLSAEIAAFKPKHGDVFEHVVYEDSKARITRRLAERGYFDADFATRKVEVTRADHAADISLRWTSGRRYDMGVIGFDQKPKRVVRDSLLQKLVYWKPGEYYHQGRLDRLRKSLTSLDYFSRIEIQPRPEDAVDGQVPVDVHLTPAKRDIYTAGVSYGTDSGGGVRLGLERRYVNDRGHKLLAQIDYATRRKTATVQYRVPAFLWLDGWYTASLQAADEQTDDSDTRRLELVGSRSGEVNKYLTAVVALHVLRERWRFLSSDPLAPIEDYKYASMLFPSVSAEYIDADDRLYPRRALGGTVLLRGAVEGVASDATFVQIHTTARWFHGLGPTDRLLVRGELGHTFTNALVEMPLSLRFFAGGDRSVRGYGWREIGPRNGDLATGAKNVITGSIEYERYFTKEWGGAVFVDTGDAFDSEKPDFHTGVGIGVRWRSPVGPVRVDVARGLNGPDAGFTLHFNIGADL
ncbi:outer membrane protein assembly factor [Lysobacter helvus]|uniref:Translocation and assembly module subunit TamA n=2 Tax=Lysobacteraceae TaxID=32033 RepID=A0ABN6FW12_9GAMM|nr:MULTISPECIES: autotransporter assembly complex family protein [Lysobacter]BCT92192.1 outer membrane protein assembly factor [Lysobacter caseinilyticus]BCT95345.1 outer membrane protein assembly factor [Lysobacter helvus]